MSKRFKLKPLALAMIPVLFSTGATQAFAAEEADEKNKDETDIEVIEVKGFRGSLQKSLNQKRLSDGVTDSIFAEDVGKTTDQNIGDALSRVTGITVQESDGEGTKISVRGAASHLNQISLNGVALTSSVSGGTSDQSVDLSTFSADILESLSVIKTPSADHDEGSLGANVILRTFRPLNVAEDRRSIEIQGRYNDFAELGNRKFAGSFSHKLFDETLGFIITAADETQSTRKDSVTGDWLEPYKMLPTAIPAGRATNSATGQPTTEDMTVMYKKSMGFNTDHNERNRQTATLGIQFVPFDSTDMQLDVSYSKQELAFDQHKISIGTPNFNEPLNNNYYNHDEYMDDPQSDWWTVDPETGTVTKMLNRFASGSIGRFIGGNETENKVATFRLNQVITDDLIMDLNIGYSGTEYQSLPNANVNTNTWNRIPLLQTLDDVPVDALEPVGYDCTTGDCQMVVGTTPYIYVPEGINNNQNNISTSGFNPNDPYMNHLGYMSQNTETSSDVNKSVFLDFDYFVDMVGVTKVEFGVKGSQRVKDVYTYNTFISKTGGTRFDPETGQPIAGQHIADILLVDVLDPGNLPVDNFMDGLIATDSKYNQDFLNGWGLLNPLQATAELYNVPDTVPQRDDSGSRKIIQDNVSAYFKLNFEYFDGALTGNIGTRYVKTDFDSVGTGSIGYSSDDRNFNVHELLYKNQILNSSLDACPPRDNSIISTPLNEAHGEGTTPCYDSLFVNDVDGNVTTQITYDANGVPIFDENTINNGDRYEGWWGLWRHGDKSTAITDTNLARATELGIPDTQIYKRNFAASGQGSTEIWLPSLNLNYAMGEDTIIRFAASRTMARPPFDDLRPNFSINEQVWGDTSFGHLSNPSLKPLKSDNLDFSYEWYFNDSGNVSLALFKKDMKDFTESVKDTYYFQDFREDWLKDTMTLDELLIVPENGMTPVNSSCHASRNAMDQIKNPFIVECEPVLLTISRNGASNQNHGLEFGYTQSYDFLPGIWGGLGATFNYTYSKSESEAEALEGTGNVLKALPMAWTPEHSSNTTLFWEQDGISFRFSHRYNGVQLISRGQSTGVLWQDESNRFDFSANYNYSDNISFSFHALNLSDAISRSFFTSTRMVQGQDADGNDILLDEGNAMDGGVSKDRTVGESKTGRLFRLSTRITF